MYISKVVATHFRKKSNQDFEYFSDDRCTGENYLRISHNAKITNSLTLIGKVKHYLATGQFSPGTNYCEIIRLDSDEIIRLSQANFLTCYMVRVI